MTSLPEMCLGREAVPRSDLAGSDTAVADGT